MASIAEVKRGSAKQHVGLNESFGSSPTALIESHKFDAYIGNEQARIKVAREADDHRYCARLAKLALKLMVFFIGPAALVASQEDAPGIVIPVGSSDATVVSNGQAASSAGLFGSITGVHQSGATFEASFTMLTDVEGKKYNIQDVPSFGSSLGIGGVGKHGYVNGSLLDQDGKPRIGTAPYAFVPGSVNGTVYGATVINGGSDFGPAPGDSGGYVGLPSGPVGIIDVGTGTNTGSKTYFTKLAPLEDWIDQIISVNGPNSIWGATAAHASIDHSDPVAFREADLTDLYNPSMRFSVIGTFDYPTWTGDFGGVDLNHPDITLVQLSPMDTPEPQAAYIMVLGGASGLLLRRQRKPAF